jgi:hypothetical protein
MDLDLLTGHIVPYVTAAVGAYGAAVLTRAEDAAADETIRLGQRLLRTMLGSRTARPGVEQAVTALAAEHNDPGFQAALRAEIRLALYQDQQLAARLAALLSDGPTPPRQTLHSAGDRSPVIGGNVGQVSTGDNSPNIQKISKRKFFIFPFGFIMRTTKTIGSAASAHPVAAATSCVLVAGAVTSGVVLAHPGARPASVALSANPCPGKKDASLPAGWEALPNTTVTLGADPGGTCIQSSVLYWAGIYMPRIGAANYTVTVTGRSLTGWGLAARVTVASGPVVTGHAIQYEPETDGFRDVDYPGDTGPHVSIATNGRWHTLAVTVRGSSYVLSLDGRRVAHGTLPQAAEASGGAFVRIWNGDAVEIRTPVITVNHS